MGHELTVPTFGVEEELLLVHGETGAPFMEGQAVRHVAASLGLDLDLELTPCQVETATAVLETSDQLRDVIANSRRTADSAAREVGGRVLACGVPPVVGDARPVSETPRYRRLAGNFGLLAREQGVCGCHVHVAVPSRRHAIAVGNRMRPWLPVFLALTANSAVHDSVDTGYCSWRSVLWSRWPSAGAPPHFESEQDYDEAVTRLISVGAALDKAMVYWDVRPSDEFPTIEVRISDVPATPGETVLYATLVRALVMTELTGLGADHTSDPQISADDLRLATWRAARDGIAGRFWDPLHHTMITTREAVERLVSYVSPALEVMGEHTAVIDAITELGASGNGAVYQRRVLAESGIDAVVDHIADRTISGDR